MINSKLESDIIKQSTKLSLYFIIVSIIGFLILMLPFLSEGFNINNYGIVGDTVGGILNPLIAIPATILTFLAFWVQFKANEQQKKDLQVERFENKFYEMLKIHRDNINEITIGKSLSGRKSFISMFNELKFTYYSVKKYYEKVYRPLNLQADINDDIIYNISYLIFFFGVGRNSSLIVLDIIGERYEGFFMSVEEFILGQQTIWRSERKIGKPIDVEIDEDTNFTLDIRYKPCNGQMSKLSHYVRHLFQLVKFVDDADEKVFDYNSKYNYIASIRSQLSAHEQLLLFYNAVSALGKPWLEKPNYLKKYCVIKSCPLPLANFYKNPRDILEDTNEYGKVMFEWGEIKQRLN